MKRAVIEKPRTRKVPIWGDKEDINQLQHFCLGNAILGLFKQLGLDKFGMHELDYASLETERCNGTKTRPAVLPIGFSVWQD